MSANKDGILVDQTVSKQQDGNDPDVKSILEDHASKLESQKVVESALGDDLAEATERLVVETLNKDNNKVECSVEDSHKEVSIEADSTAKVKVDGDNQKATTSVVSDEFDPKPISFENDNLSINVIEQNCEVSKDTDIGEEAKKDVNNGVEVSKDENAETLEKKEGDTDESVPTKSKNSLKKEKRRALARERRLHMTDDADFTLGAKREKRKADEDITDNQDIKKAKLETKALKAKRPGFSEERYNETSYYIENGLRKVYPYYFTFTTFTKGRWVGEKILDVFAKEFRAHPAEEYERCIKSGTLTVNYERVDTDCRLKHNDLLANIVHRHETPVLARNIEVMHLDEELVVLDKPCSLPVHPCGRYRHNTVVFILAKEYNLKNLRTIHRLDRLTSGLLLFGRTPKKAREMEQQIRTRQVSKQYVCRVEGRFPSEMIECNEPIEVVSYKIGVCKVAPTGKDCKTDFQLLSYANGQSVVLCKPLTGRMHQIRVHLQYLGYPIVNDPLYNHLVFGPNKGKGGITSKSDEQLIQDLIAIHNAENWLGMDGDVEYSMFKAKDSGDNSRNTPSPKDKVTDPATPCSVASLPTPSPTAITTTPTHCKGITRPTPSPPAITTTPAHGDVSPGGEADVPEDGFKAHMKTVDKNCYECKVRYRDPKPKDLVMYLHALKYSGPGWSFETKMPLWAAADYQEDE